MYPFFSLPLPSIPIDVYHTFTILHQGTLSTYLPVSAFAQGIRDHDDQRPWEIRSRGSRSGLGDRARHFTKSPVALSDLGFREDVLNSTRIMRGYHIRIRVTAQSSSTITKTPATTAATARAAWATDTFVPKSIFESLPSHTPRKTSRINATLGSKRRDYRYGPIRIDWLDLKGSSQPPSSTQESKSGISSGAMGDTPTMGPSGSGKEKDLRGRGRSPASQKN